MAIAKLSFKNVFLPWKNNINIVLSYLSGDFSSFTEPDQDTWLSNSFYGSLEEKGIYMFKDFFLRLFHSINTSSSIINSVYLSGGSVEGYGVDTYGVGTFGTPRTGYTVSNSFNDRTNRRFVISWNPIP